MKRSFFRRAMTAAAFVGLAACSGDPTGTGNLSEAELEDMMDAMDAIGAFSFATFNRVGTSPGVAALVIPVDDEFDCPGGGTMSQSGSVNANEHTGAVTGTVTTDYNDCKGTSSSGRVWTFNGDPSIAMTINYSQNLNTGAFTMSGTQSGGLRFSSNAGSGACSVSLTYSYGVTSTGTVTGSVTGTVCGESVSHSLTD